MSLWLKQEHLCHSGASLALLAIATDKQEQLCLNVVYRHRWALFHLGSLCLGLLPGSRRPLGLRSGCEQREGERDISAGQGSAFWHRDSSWLLFWLPASLVFLGLLSVSCCLLVGAGLGLRWTFSRVEVILQETQGWCFSRADLHEGCHRIIIPRHVPFVATREGDVLCFFTPGSGKFCSFNFLGSYQHESKCQRTGLSLRTHQLFFF